MYLANLAPSPRLGHRYLIRWLNDRYQAFAWLSVIYYIISAYGWKISNPIKKSDSYAGTTDYIYYIIYFWIYFYRKFCKICKWRFWFWNFKYVKFSDLAPLKLKKKYIVANPRSVCFVTKRLVHRDTCFILSR